MTEGSNRLVMYGFIQPKASFKYPSDTEGRIKLIKSWIKEKNKEKLKEVEDDADHDWMEVAPNQLMMMDYPKPINRYYLITESFHQSIEPIYFWCLNHLVNDLGFPIVHKITDLFTASEHSSFYGAAAQRLGLAQDKVMTFLATIGKMTKDMFQLVRELRILDERIHYYEGALKGDTGAEIALKGLWVDMVDGVVGGQRTGSNLLIMAQQLQFTTLPDLFFSIHPKSPEEVDEVVETEAKEFNRMVKAALKRKLFAYLTWRKETYKEILSRKKFTLNYLRQHFNIIKMYMNWVKPYMKHIERLGGEISRVTSPELIAAFEGSLVEIEILAQKLPEGNKDVYACALMTFHYRTKPTMQFPGEGGYHRGPIHVGHTTITWRSYAWTKEEIENYLKMKDIEDLELLTSIDKSLKDAMEALGEDMIKYLKEAEEGEQPKAEEAAVKVPGALGPFTAVGKGVLELFGALLPKKPAKAKAAKPAKAELARLEKEKENAKNEAKKMLWNHYKNFKKAHKMLTW